ncbi:DUF3515 domain-containing protein [Actinopolymorpha pittospori]
MKRATRWSAGGAALLCLLAVSGCGASTVTVEPPHPSGTAATTCRSLMAALPAKVLEQPSRPVQPEGALAATWGDPPILLRCGVPRPAKLRSNSTCLEVEGVGWFAEKAARGYIFTTVGRSAYVEMSVPSAYEPPANALVDVGEAIRRTVPVRTACV